MNQLLNRFFATLCSGAVLAVSPGLGVYEAVAMVRVRTAPLEIFPMPGTVAGVTAPSTPLLNANLNPIPGQTLSLPSLIILTVESSAQTVSYHPELRALLANTVPGRGIAAGHTRETRIRSGVFRPIAGKERSQLGRLASFVSAKIISRHGPRAAHSSLRALFHGVRPRSNIAGTETSVSGNPAVPHRSPATPTGKEAFARRSRRLISNDGRSLPREHDRPIRNSFEAAKDISPHEKEYIEAERQYISDIIKTAQQTAAAQGLGYPVDLEIIVSASGRYRYSPKTGQVFAPFNTNIPKAYFEKSLLHEIGHAIFDEAIGFFALSSRASSLGLNWRKLYWQARTTNDDETKESLELLMKQVSQQRNLILEEIKEKRLLAIKGKFEEFFADLFAVVVKNDPEITKDFGRNFLVNKPTTDNPLNLLQEYVVMNPVLNSVWGLCLEAPGAFLPKVIEAANLSFRNFPKWGGLSPVYSQMFIFELERLVGKTGIRQAFAERGRLQ
ncbi:hypothetical protein ACFL2T_02320 [Elusimicrobiota bacterium]